MSVVQLNPWQESRSTMPAFFEEKKMKEAWIEIDPNSSIFNRNLPEPIEKEIFTFSDARDLCQISSVSRKFRKLCHIDRYWQKLFQIHHPETHPNNRDGRWKSRFKSLYLQKVRIINKSKDKERIASGKKIMIIASSISSLFFIINPAFAIQKFLYVKDQYYGDLILSCKIESDLLDKQFDYNTAYGQCGGEKNMQCKIFVNQTVEIMKEAVQLLLKENYQRKIDEEIPYFTAITITAVGIAFVYIGNIISISNNTKKQSIRILNLLSGAASIGVGAIASSVNYNTSGAFLLGGGSALFAQGIISNRKLMRVSGIINKKISSICSRITACFTSCFRKR